MDTHVPIQSLAADGESSGKDLLKSLILQENRGFFQLEKKVYVFLLNGIFDAAEITPQFTF